MPDTNEIVGAAVRPRMIRAPRKGARWAPIIALFVLGTLSTAGCGGTGGGAALAPSSESPHYAVDYPERLEATRFALEDELAAAGFAIEQFPSYPEALSSPDWGKVLYMVEQADRDGRSEAFVEEVRRTRVLERFLDEHGEWFSRSVARDIERAVERDLDEEDYHSRRTVIAGMKDAVSEHREESLTDVSDALQSLEWFEEELSEADARVLREQLISIALASYIVHVQAVQLRADLERDLDQAATVKETLQTAQSTADARAESPDLTERQRAIVGVRKEHIKNALARIDEDIAAARASLEAADAEIERLQEDYDENLEALRRALIERAEDAALGPDDAEESEGS